MEDHAEADSVEAHTAEASAVDLVAALAAVTVREDIITDHTDTSHRSFSDLEDHTAMVTVAVALEVYSVYYLCR